MQLSAVDLNLLVVLATLLETRSVKAAAARLALSPSATSHALGRLRTLTGDPLLVRAGRRLVPTARAEALRPALVRFVHEAEAVLRAGDAVDPAALARAFRVLTNDYGELLLLAPLGAALAQEARHVDLYALPAGVRDVSEALRNGDADLAIGAFADLPPDVAAAPLLEDEFVCLLRAGHPALRGRLTKRRFLALEHVLVAPRGEPVGVVDRLLAERGETRRVARTVSGFLVAPALVASTDYVVTISRRVAERVADVHGLAVRKAPIAPEGFTIRLAWHRRADGDPAHRWLRERLLALAATL